MNNPTFTSQTKDYLSTPQSKFPTLPGLSKLDMSSFAKEIHQDIIEALSKKNTKKLNSDVKR